LARVLLRVNGNDQSMQPDSVVLDDHQPATAAEKPQQQGSPGGVPPEHRLLTTAEVAEYFRVTPRTVETWRAKRLLPYRKLGRTIRYKLGDLQQALDVRFLVKRR